MKPLTLTRRIALSVALLALLTVALTGGTAFMILRGQVVDTMNHSLEHSAEDIARIVENRLEAINDSLTTLAANTLMANALADNEGRERYLGSFLESYQSIAGLAVNLSLTDFRGRALSSAPNVPLVFDPEWVAERVERNDAAAIMVERSGETWLVLARPVIYANTGLPEGALVLQFRLNQLMALNTHVAHIDDWRHSAHFALYLGETLPNQNAFFAGLPKPENGVGLRYPLHLPDNLSPLQAELEVAIDPTRFNAPLRQLVYSAAGLSVLVLLMVSVVSAALGRILTRRLRRLEEAAQQITHEAQEQRRLPITGHDEVTSLARSFNHLLDNLQQAFDELQQKSRSLEHALEQADEARNEAEHANKTKSIFLANMSHELRTPLNAIIGFAQLLGRDPEMSEQQHRSLTTIHRSGEHLLSLINDVLELSRIEAGQLELTEAPLHLHELLAAVTDVLRLRADEKGLTLSLAIAPDLPVYIVADQRKLRQILINLLGNAVKFTDQGSVTLAACLEDDQLCLEVRDTGPGIPADEQTRIFDPFRQGKGHHREEGTGLGLAISREFVQLMGGRLTLDSSPGEGTTFRVILPCRTTSGGALLSSQQERHVVALQAGQSARILVVDDRQEGRELLSSLLESAGFEVRCASDGAEAIKLFRAWHPQLIWMDMRMPVIDGYEATRRIRTMPEGQRTTIIALTASAFEEDRSAVLEAGCDHFMRKPVDNDEVFEVIGRFLGVKYRYARSAGDRDGASGTKDFSAAADALPVPLRRRLATAATALDVDATLEAIAEITALDPELGAHLEALSSDFRYDELVRLSGDAHVE